LRTSLQRTVAVLAKRRHRDSGHGWIYLGSYRHLFRVYIYRDLSKLKIHVYNPKTGRDEVFILGKRPPAGVALLILLNIEDIIYLNKIDEAYLQRYLPPREAHRFYIMLRSRLKRILKMVHKLRGVTNLPYLLGLDDDTFRTLYGKFMPFMKKVKGVTLRLRSLFEPNAIYRREYWRKIQRVVRIIHDPSRTRMDDLEVLKRCLLIVDTLRERGYIGVHRVKGDPVKVSVDLEVETIYFEDIFDTPDIPKLIKTFRDALAVAKKLVINRVKELYSDLKICLKDIGADPSRPETLPRSFDELPDIMFCSDAKFRASQTRGFAELGVSIVGQFARATLNYSYGFLVEFLQERMRKLGKRDEAYRHRVVDLLKSTCPILYNKLVNWVGGKEDPDKIFKKFVDKFYNLLNLTTFVIDG